MKPDFPVERITSILEDTACNLLITDVASQSVLASFEDIELILFEPEVCMHPERVGKEKEGRAIFISTAFSLEEKEAAF